VYFFHYFRFAGLLWHSTTVEHGAPSFPQPQYQEHPDPLLGADNRLAVQG